MTIAQLQGQQDFPKAELAYKYVHGKPLVRPDQVQHLPTQMRRLHDWYMQVTQEERIMLMVQAQEEHYFRKEEICIMLEELFQLYNQDAIDKSLVSCYCL